MNNQKILKIVKIAALSLACALLLYLTYAVITQFVVWSMQPKFTNGVQTTSSLGFLIQNFIFIGFFIIDAAGVVVMALLFYILPARKRKKESLQKAA